jgi:hypothetical protein
MEPTFKQRVHEFWTWYAQVAERFRQTIDAGDCASLADEVGEFIDETLPGFGWVFGPGQNGGHSFTLTGDGQVAKQLLTRYWLAAAPDIPTWTFYASRQPTPIDKLRTSSIRVSESESVDVETFLVRTEVDEENEQIDIVAWHPAYDSVPSEHHLMILFILLDEALGEFGTEMWLGEIKIQKFERDSKTRTIADLPEFIKQMNAYHQWQKLPPLESCSVYQMTEQTDGPRRDTVVGSSVIAGIVMDYIDNGGKLDEDPIAGTGAELVYIAIDGEVFPDGQQADVRGNIDGAISESLQTNVSGETLGGAFGVHESYIELLLFDGERSREILERTLSDLQLHGRYRLEPFA